MPGKEKNIVLVVSRANDILRELIATLGMSDFSYMHAVSVAEALNNIERKPPHIIISETDLPDENGLSFCNMIRSRNSTKLIPFILVATSNRLHDRIHAIQQGADVYLAHPINYKELRAHILSKINQFNEFYLLSITDELTRLYNRREFFKKFHTQLKEDPYQTIALVLLDLDYFKQVNDVHGHQMGDIVLMKFATILKKRISSSFFPTRFGGEEFVILLPGITAFDAKTIIDAIRKEFNELDFMSTDNKNFHVSFSAGVSEYPTIGSNLSLLLSRADQALYAAKKDGRGLTYIFSSMMARNDRFWEYLKKSNGFFINNKMEDSITDLPYIPRVLEIISNYEYEINNIGIIIMQLQPPFDFHTYYGIRNFDYMVENITFIIKKTCNKHFASETFISISSFFETEFCILFPSLAEFNLNQEKCRNLYETIVTDIHKQIKSYPLDLLYTSSIIYHNKNEPRKLLLDIQQTRQNVTLLQKASKHKKYNAIKNKITKNLQHGESLKKLFILDYYYHTTSHEKELTFIRLASTDRSYYTTDFLLQAVIKDKNDLESFSHFLGNELSIETPVPLMIPYIEHIDYREFITVLKKHLKKQPVIITLNEQYINMSDFEYIHSCCAATPDTMSIALDNCYISSDILHLISEFDFKYLFFSEYITRNIHFFRSRIKIVNGVKIFLDQMNIKVCAKNILRKEELEILSDINIDYVSGSICKNFSK